MHTYITIILSYLNLWILDYESLFSIYPINLFHLGFLIVIILSYYPIDKILKHNHLNKIVKSIDQNDDFFVKWFKFKINRSNSLILFSTSIALIALYIYRLILVNMQAQWLLVNLDPMNYFLLFSFPSLIALICVILVIFGYTIVRTFPAVKSNKIREYNSK
jgi:hypothetical protein